MKKGLLFCLVAALSIVVEAATRAESLRAKFDSSDTNYVFVIAHRADWRHHPENSISALEGAITMGADMVEIDVAKTKDGVFVLSHDGKLDRVSDKKGAIKDLTLAEVKSARLKMGQGGASAALTDERVPTLVEALEVCRGKILVNIDKFYVDPNGITDIIQKLGIAKQVVLKGHGDYAWVKQSTGAPWQHVENRDFIYMPIVSSGKTPKELADVRAACAAWDAAPYAPPAYEVCVPGDAPLALFADFRTSPHRPRLWINTLWDSLAHGHSETLEGPDFTADKVWGYWVDLGATMIQTDDPAALVKYLAGKSRHTLGLSVARAEKEPGRADFQQIRVSTGGRMACCEVGETMRLLVDVIGTNGQRVAGLPIDWKRRGDDGRTETGSLVSAAEPVEVSVSMACPGEIRFDFTAGEPKPAIMTKDFSGGIIVAPERIRVSAAPSDLEAFWTKQRAALAQVPVKVLEEKVAFSNDAWCVYDLKIACAGKRPVSGYLTKPTKASPKSLPIKVCFYGYSVGSAERHFDPKAITFGVNAHGIENGREEAYYAALSNGELAGYALNRVEKPEDSYLLGMCLRAVRAVEYMKMRPEWDGRTLIVGGHSQGGFQALMAASFDPDVTRVEANEPWMCNVGSPRRGGLPGFDPAYSPALEYFDPAHLIDRTRAEIDLIGGLCDDVCPAGRIAAVWNAAPGHRRITFYQAKNHFWEINWTSAFTLE